MDFIKNVWLFLSPYRANLVKALSWTLAMQVLALVEPYLLMFIFDDVIAHGVEAIPRIPWMAATAFVLLVATTISKVLKDRRIRAINVAISTEVETRVLAKFLRLSLSYHHGTNAGESVSKAKEGVRRLDEITRITLFDLAPLLLQTVIVTAVLLWWHWSIALLVLGTLLVSWTALIMVKNHWRESRQERHRLTQRIDRDFSESIANVMTVQAFSKEADVIRKDADKQEEWRKLFVTELAAYDKNHLVRNSFVNLMRVATVLLCMYYYFRGHLTIGQCMLVQMLVERLFNANFQLGTIYDRCVDASEPIRVLAEVMREPETQKDPEQPLPVPAAPLTLSLKDVSYAYPSRPNQAVLSDVTLKIKAGTMVGIVGESGQGKSTLAKLLLRFDDPTVGAITMNGQDMRQFLKADARKLVGYVPQEVELFNATIAENIRYGAPNATDEDMRRAAELARALPFILKTEKGFDTLIGDRGLRLSGGERQRVGIARAVLTGAPILIFDEATSSVDPETIFEIKRAMNSLREARTLVVISHQLSTIQDADMIVVLREGRVSGTGKHVDLMRNNETYKGFVQRQQNADSALLITPDPRSVS